MGYYGAPTYPAAHMYDPCCPTPMAAPAYVPAYPVAPARGGAGFGIALVVVVVILLVILGALYLYRTPGAPV
ncbi:sporulation protein YjcZ [Anaerobacillus alkaliphilus]|uniref:Sporulation protein YjcZ n=1 Tax=Anaerobacillus alkaliphilus TaxID=1548597 RepID=A0A4Q0VY30_9BACI|nr:sporulation protein YjcZ [Anaerobacillus alkaliphilus]RXJ04322.1 sporulation protein YjcZ [Anaerobacillus alkaliphilus]